MIDSGESEREGTAGNAQEGDEKDKIAPVGNPYDVTHFGADTRGKSYSGGGRRSRATVERRGHYVRSAKPTGKVRAFNEIAVDATVRAAALRQSLDGKPTYSSLIKSADYRIKIRESKVGNLILFVVDASGSMAAKKRMTAIKGAILSLLLDAYQKRDQVGLITFRHKNARLVLPPTNSTDLAQKLLYNLPTGGRTPLAQALILTDVVLRKYTSNELAPLVVLISDCRGNVLLNSSRQLIKPTKYLTEVLQVADLVAQRKVSSLVIDCETGRGKLGFPIRVAQALGGECLRLEEVSAESITQTVRTMRQ